MNAAIIVCSTLTNHVKAAQKKMNTKTSSKAGGTADIKIIRPGIRLCIPGLFALRKILSERKILKK